MAEMSSADKSYVAEMTAHHKGAIEIAKKYLAAGPGSRNANLSEMARKVIADQMAEMAKMASMMGAKPMPAKGM